MLKIIQIYGRIGGPKAIELLWNKIDFPDKILVTEVLSALGDCGFKANLNQITRIKFAIESDIEDIAWNLACIDEIPNNEIGKQLREAIREENTHDIDHIYTLLAMLYDSKSIQLVKENIESGTSDGVTYAIELLDVFLSDDLKQKIIPVLDDMQEAEKARRLEVFFPRETLGSKEVLKHLINRDFNQTNRWSKACAIRQIGHMKINEYLYDLIANLFNPDPMVMEIAAWAIYKLDEKQYHEHTERLGFELKNELDMLVLSKSNRKLRFEKVMFLKEMFIFSKVPGRILANLVDAMEEINIPEGESFALDSIFGNNFYVVFEGQADYFQQGAIKKTIESGEFVGELIDDEYQDQSNLFMAKENTTLLVIQKDKFYELLSDNYLFAQSVMSYLYAS